MYPNSLVNTNAAQVPNPQNTAVSPLLTYTYRFSPYFSGIQHLKNHPPQNHEHRTLFMVA